MQHGGSFTNRVLVFRCKMPPFRTAVSSLNKHPNQPVGLISETPRIWCHTGFPPVDIAVSLQFAATAGRNWTRFSVVDARRFCLYTTRMPCSRWYLPWCVDLMTPWLDQAQPADIWAAVILGNDGPTKFRGNESGEAVQYQHSYGQMSQTPSLNFS